MQKTDLNTSIADLKTFIANFRKDRNWDKDYDDPYDIAVALSVEASEILQLLLWGKNTDFKSLIAADPKLKKLLTEEIVDVLAFTLTLSNSIGIDLSQAFFAKMEKNATKYPIVEGAAKPRKRWLE